MFEIQANNAAPLMEVFHESLPLPPWRPNLEKPTEGVKVAF